MSIGAQHIPVIRLSNYFRDVGTDLSQGGSRTGIGKALGFLQGRQNGYSGLNSGTSEGAANLMGSPLTGTAQALEGLSSTPQHPVGGLVKALGGSFKAAQIPLMFAGGPELTAAAEAVPSAKFAGSQLANLATHAGNIDNSAKSDNTNALQRLAEISQQGGAGTVPPGLMQLLERSQAIAPMGYPEARTFVSNISRLSSLEKMAAKPEVLSNVGQVASGLHGDIANALGPELGPHYLDMVNQYARGMALKQNTARIAGNTLGAIGKAATIGALGYGTYEAGKKINAK